MPAPTSAPSAAPPRGARSVEVRGHRWAGYHCESRLVRAALPAPRRPDGAPGVPPLLMIGGAFQRKESWGRLEREFLAAGMDVLTVDPPGWGAADLLPAGLGADFLADAVCHMVAESGVGGGSGGDRDPAGGRVNVVGGSYGTAIAYRLAQRHPARVDRVVLVGTMTAIPAHAQAAMRRTMDHLAARRMEEFAHASVGVLMNTDRLDAVTAGARVRSFLLRRLTNLAEDEAEQTHANTLRLLTQRMLDPSSPPGRPVLVATGEHDSFTTPALCRELAATCERSWFAEVSHADHMLYLERTPELADLVVRFLTGRPLTGLGYCRRVERVV
jgi:pimeloyl-ACP methyl ester carboxylesterase